MKFYKILTLITAIFVFMASPNIILSQDDVTDENFANYSAGLSLSPFGGAVGFTHNWNEKTSFQAAIGGFSGTAPVSPEINGNTYDINNSTSWIGMFVNHRPFEKYDWIRLATGFGMGTIKNTLTTAVNDDEYQANYEGNIVGYVGFGFGGRPKKGLILSADLGLLSTSGAKVTGPDPMIAKEIADDAFFGSILPNFQFGIAWGF